MEECQEILISLLRITSKNFWPEIVRNGERLHRCLDLAINSSPLNKDDDTQFSKLDKEILKKTSSKCSKLAKQLSSLYHTVLQEYLEETLRLTPSTIDDEPTTIDYTNEKDDSIEDDDIDHYEKLGHVISLFHDGIDSSDSKGLRMYIPSHVRVSDGKYRFNEKRYLEDNAAIHKSIVKIQKSLYRLMGLSDLADDEELKRMEDIEDLYHGLYHRFTRYLHRCFTGYLNVSHTIGMRIRINPFHCLYTQSTSNYHCVDGGLLYGNWSEYTSCEELNEKESRRRECIYMNKLKNYFAEETALGANGVSSLEVTMLSARNYASQDTQLDQLQRLSIVQHQQDQTASTPNIKLNEAWQESSMAARMTSKIEEYLQCCIQERRLRRERKRENVAKEMEKRRGKIYVAYGPARDLDEKEWKEFCERQKVLKEEEKKELKKTGIREQISKDLFQAIRQNKPLVLPGNVAHIAVGGEINEDDDIFPEQSSKFKQFTSLDTLRKIFGNCPISIAALKDGSESKPPFVAKLMLFKKFLFRCQSYVGGKEFAGLHYLQQVELDTLDEYVKGVSIYETFGIEPLFPAALCEAIRPEACHHPTLYINMAGGIKTSLHYDRSRTTFSVAELEEADASTVPQAADPGKHNIFVQLTGSRTFVLFPPHCAPDMIPFDESHINHISQSTTFLHSVSAHSSDLKEQLKFIAASDFPSLARPWEHRIEITLNAGDALLIPAGWWHYTHLHTPGIALNWWFAHDCLPQRRLIRI